jgi:hypothetical protein
VLQKSHRPQPAEELRIAELKKLNEALDRRSNRHSDGEKPPVQKPDHSEE